MSWLSSWWDKASGANQKVDPNKLGTQYDDAMSGVNRGYDKISEFASGMMDPYSQQNMAMRSMMNQQGADTAAQGARLGDRSAAMAGGAPAAALAAQSSAGANQAMAGSNQAFNQYLSGAQGQGAGMLSGVLANQGQMQDRKFNMVQSQRQANAMADTQGAQFGANLLGQAIGMIPGLGGLPGGQTGGHVGYQEGGEGMAYDNIDSEITFYKEGGSVGPQYGPDGKPRFLLGGLLAGTFALGALKKGYNALGGGKGGESISESLGRAKDWGASGLDEMKKEAKDTNFYYTKEGAEDAMMEKYLKTDEGKTGSDLAKEVSDDELSLANIGKNKDYDEDFQTREMLSKDKHQAFLDKERANFDTSQGDDRVGAGRALGENIGAVTGPIVSSIAEGAGLLGKAAVGTAGAIKKDWQKEKGSIGKGLLKGSSELLKEIGSPGYLQGKEMAQIKRLGKDRDLKLDEIVPEEIVTPKVEKNYDQPEAVDKVYKTTSAQVDDFSKSGVDTNQGPLLPNVILSKVTNIEDLKNLDREQIKTIQASLAKAGYDMPKSLKADGTYDGEAGEETLAMMQKWMDEQVLGEQVEGEHGDVETRSMSTPDINFDPQFQQGGLLSLGMQEGGDPRDKYKDIDPRFYVESGMENVDPRFYVESGMENVDPGFYAPSDARSRLDDLLGRVTLNGDSRDFDVEHPSIRDEMLMRAQEVPRGDGANAELYDGLSELGKESMRGRLLKKAGAEGYQEGGTVWNQGSGQNPNNQVSGGILSQVMGPKGPMNIPTRIGGFRVTG